MVEAMKIMATPLQRSYAHTAAPSAPNLVAGHPQPMPPLETPGHSQASLGQSLVRSLLLSPESWCTRFCLCPPRVCFPVLCKFWQLYVRVNGDLLQEGLCRTQVSCTQNLCPCGRPWPTLPPQEMLKYISVSVYVGSLGPGAHKVCLSLLSISGGNGI